MKLGEALVEVRADIAKFKADMRAAHTELNRGVGSMVRTLRSAAGAFGLYLGGRQLIAFAQSAFRAAMVQEEADRQLAASLRMIGRFSNDAMRDLKNFAAEIQRNTTYGDEAVESIMSLGAALGHLSGDQLKKATIAAIGWSEIIGVDARTAMNMMARAAQGNFALWSRYTADLQRFNTAAEKMAFLLKRGAEGFEIQRQRAQTTAGQLKQLRNYWSDLKEIWAAAFAKGMNLNRVLADMKKGAGSSETKRMVRDYGEAAGIVGRWGIEVAKGFYHTGKALGYLGAAVYRAPRAYLSSKGSMVDLRMAWADLKEARRQWHLATTAEMSPEETKEFAKAVVRPRGFIYPRKYPTPQIPKPPTPTPTPSGPFTSMLPAAQIGAKIDEQVQLLRQIAHNTANPPAPKLP